MASGSTEDTATASRRKNTAQGVLRLLGAILLVAATLLLWPVMVPAVGAALVAGGILTRRRSTDDKVRTWAMAAIAAGIVMLVLVVLFNLFSIGVRSEVGFKEVPTFLSPPPE
jgi:hypothetical protein